MKIVELSGGVGGARMARGLAALPEVELTVVVNVGDDEVVHGLHVSADIDTVIYTLAGQEGAEGWGRAGDTFTFNEELGRFGVDNRFRLGDRDLALNLYRTNRLNEGAPLSTVTAEIATVFGVSVGVIPATDDPLRTTVRTAEGWLAFQDYFVLRQNRDEVLEVRYDGAEDASSAPGVVTAIETADMVVIAPSNPPLSIWPVLAVEGVREAVARHSNVVAVSPLFGGKALKGPADRVMASLGLPPGNAGVVAAYDGLIGLLVIDSRDSDSEELDVETLVTDTLIKDPEAAMRLAQAIINR